MLEMVIFRSDISYNLMEILIQFHSLILHNIIDEIKIVCLTFNDLMMKTKPDVRIKI